MTTSSALDRRAYQGKPIGYPTKSFPNGEFVLHPSKWNRVHWSYDNDLRTRGKSVHKPITTTEALDLITKLMTEHGEGK